MNDPHAFLHTAEPVETRIERALSWLADPASCPISDQGPAAAKCFLMYRYIDGLLTKDRMTLVSLTETPVANPVLAARWAMSHATAVVYLNILKGPPNGIMAGARLASDARELWAEREINRRWPPQIINYLRMSMIDAYSLYLTGQDAVAGEMVNQTMIYWRQHMAALDWKKWPYIFTEESVGQSMAARLLVFLGRACGIVKFRDHAAVSTESIMTPQPGEHVFYTAVRAMHALNPERALWK